VALLRGKKKGGQDADSQEINARNASKNRRRRGGEGEETSDWTGKRKKETFKRDRDVPCGKLPGGKLEYL